MNELTWLQKHERLIVVLVGLFVILYIGHFFLDKYFDIEKQKETIASAQLQQKDVQVSQLLASYVDLQKQNQQRTDELEQQNNNLTAHIQSTLSALAASQAADQKLNNQQLAVKIGELTGKQNIQSSDGGVNLTHDQAVGTAEQLENVPSLKKQLDDSHQIESNLSESIASLTIEGETCKNLVTNLKQESQDKDKKYSAQIKAIKVQGIKSKFRWFGAGYVAGLLTRTFF